MPGKITKVDGFQVTWGGKVVAKATSKTKAELQLKLLGAIKHGFKPTGKKKGGK